MEFSARYTLAGLFVLATLFGVFGFVYWLTNSAGIGETAPYRIRFTVPVSGLSEGSDILFNGIKIGEVTALRFDPRAPDVTIADAELSTAAPIHDDTTVGIAYKGLTGAASILMTGGRAEARPPSRTDGIPTLDADPSASRSWTDNAGRVLGRLDNLLSENSGRFDAILVGLERLAGGGGTKSGGVYDLPTPKFPNVGDKQSDWQLVVAEPTILLALNTDKVQVKEKDGLLAHLEGVRWTDNLPNLFQLKFIRAFENAGYADSILRPADVFDTELRLAVDIRDFHFSRDGSHAQARIMAKLIDQDGRIVVSRLIDRERAVVAEGTISAVEAMQIVFAEMTGELIEWTVAAIEQKALSQQ